MFPQKMFVRFYLLVMFLLPAIGCQHPSPVAPTVAKQTGSFSLTLLKESMPQEIRLITITLSRPDLESIVRHVAVADSSVSVRIDSLRIGHWHLQADAKDSVGTVIYSGWTYVYIEPGRVTRVILRLEKTTGSLEVNFIWPGSKLVIFYDFNDGQLPSWGGNALIRNEDGVIKITTTEPISIKWEIFDRGYPGQFTKGILELDAKFGNESSSIALNGHSASGLSNINWGPYVGFGEGRVRYLQPHDHVVETNSTYVIGDWYHIRISFNNYRGERGRYTLHLRNITAAEPEFLVGEFDYLASNGPLADMVQYTLVANTLGKVPSTSFYVDNLRLEVE